MLNSPRPASDVALAIEQSLQRRFGFTADMVVRTQEDLERVIAKDPLREISNNESRYLVTFFSEPLSPATADAVEQADFGAEAYAWCPEGIRDSPMLVTLSKIKGPRPSGTMRNWYTLPKLAVLLTSSAMAPSPEAGPAPEAPTCWSRRSDGVGRIPLTPQSVTRGKAFQRSRVRSHRGEGPAVPGFLAHPHLVR